MKSYNGLYDAMLEHGNVVSAIRDASEGKRKRKNVKKVLENIDAKADILIKKVREERWSPPVHERKRLEEGTHKKVRMIERPEWDDEQLMHHVLMTPFKPLVMKSLYRYAFGSVPTQVIPLSEPIQKGKRVVTCQVIKRGPLDAMKIMRRWRDQYHGKKFYVFEGDIKSFYDNVDLNILKGMLTKKIRDKRYLNELFKVIDGSGPGLPKGFYTSPWLAHFYLTKLDYFITQQLKPDHYLRYMDNFYITHRNKKELHAMVERIQEFMDTELRVHFNGSRQVYRFEYKDRKSGKVRGRAINCLGYVIHYNRVTLRKSILKRVRAKANKLHKSHRCKRIDAASMLSRMGWITHTDTYGYFQRWIKPKVSIRYCKRRISTIDKKRAKMKKEAKQHE